MSLSLKSRFLLIIALVFTIIFAVIISLNYTNMKQGILQHRLEEAENVKNILMATRRVYHHQFLSSGLPLTDKTLGFLPAYAMSRISTDFDNRSNSGMTFNNVSDRPRNPENAADEIELEAMKFFRENPEVKQRIEYLSTDTGNHYYHYTMPIYIEEYCLNCHGNKEDAPLTIRQRYEGSYGYKIGELRGLMSIKISGDKIESALYASIRSFAFVFIVSFFISLFLVYLVMDKIFLNQLNKIIAASKKIASGNFDINIPVNNEGELGKVAIAFNSMTEALQDWQSKQDKLHEKAYRYKDQMQFVFDNTASVIYMKDLKGQYIYINNTFEKTFNISNEEIFGKTDSDIMPIESAKNCSESDQKVLAIGNQVEFTESVPLDDGVHTYTSTKFPLKSQNGEIYGIGGISTDITERLKSEKVLNDRLDELEQFNLMTVGRELKMLELKKEINQLLIQQGKDSKYKVEK